MLTREQRDKWADELESGRWKQCRGWMRDGQKRCCLGVLADAVLEIPCQSTWDLLDAYVLENALLFVTFNDSDRLTFRQIAKHVRALPISGEERQP